MKTLFEQAVEELKALCKPDPNGVRILPSAEEVHEWARTHPKSALHGMIEWDKDKAAYQHQLFQIRGIIRRAEIYFEDPAEPAEASERLFFTLPAEEPEEGRGRERETFVAQDYFNDPERRRKAVIEVLRRMLAPGESYPSLTELDASRKFLRRQIDKYEADGK